MATDRRTKYTKSVIRQALFDLLKEKPLNKITVTDICKWQTSTAVPSILIMKMCMHC